MDIASWLRQMGLEQYEPVFRAHAIDGSVLASLTAEDLKDLGVELVGHRRKLLDAIAALHTGPTPVSGQQATMPAGAERRHLTVLFCDLVGSTPLSTRFDPEDLREIIGAYHRRVADCVAAFDGFVAKYMGDGVLAYFGYPQAHEDDAERAVRSALTLTTAVAQVASPLPLRVRIGIASGLVVVGDLVGTGEAQERGIVGETPNLAARLQALAEPNAIIVADGTRREIGALFELCDRGPQTLAGFPEPQRAWRIMGEDRELSRFEALRSGATPLVGRDEEIALLRRRWARARDGEGHAVLIAGEAGVGKSRLSAGFFEQMREEPHLRLRHFCSPYHQDSALHPIIVRLERAAGFAPDDPPERRLDRLEALLALTAPSTEELALFAELLSLPGADRYRPLDMTPQRKKEKTFEAWLRQLECFARQQPIILLFEDLHWIDASSGELLDLLIEKIEGWPVLLIATFRPDFQPRWTGQPQVTTLSLTRLNRQHSAELVARIAGPAGALPSDLAAEIVERCDGVPLFLEELTKATIEQAAAPERARSLVGAVPGPGAVPATLQASLMARLDRLGAPARELAQVGAAIGREFTFELLAAVDTRDRDALQGALLRLVSAGLVFQRGALPQATFLFKHALVQDAAYGSLLRERRHQLHSRIAEALLSAERAAAPEIIAHHLQNAGRASHAIGYWREAGERAVRRAANREAIEHFHRALALLETEPESAERWRDELAVLSQLVPALMHVYGWTAPEVGEAAERAAAVGRRLKSSADIAPSVANLWLYQFSRFRLDLADEISADLFRIAGELDDPEIRLQACHCAWPTAYQRGHFVTASEQIEAGLRLYDEKRHAHHRNLYLGHDPAACALSTNASVQVALGYLDRASRLEAEAISFADQLQHPPTLAVVLWLVCEARASRRDTTDICAPAQRLLELSEANGLLQSRAHALMSLGWALSLSGYGPEGVAKLQEAAGTVRRIGHQRYLMPARWLMAEALLAAGRYAEGLQEVDHAIDMAAKAGVALFDARLHQVRAGLLLHVDPSGTQAAEMSLRHAIAVAQEQGAKGFELQAATDLARLWGEQGKRTEARNLLAPIYEQFTEGFAEPVLRDAKALLDAL
jgi:class 3 adenylate cyclase/predicted ATPase